MTAYLNTLGILLLLWPLWSGCSSSNFGGVSASKSKSKATKDDSGGSDEEENDDEDGPEDSVDETDQGDGSGSSGDGDIGTDTGDASGDTTDLADGALDEEGILRDDCTMSISLPAEPTELQEVFNWNATGPTAAYTQVMATPVIARLRKSDEYPTIVAPAFQSCNYQGGGAYLYGIDGKTGTQKWVSSMKVMTSASAALGDINKDGIVEVVAYGLDGKTYALNPDGAVIWTSADVTTSTGDSFLNDGGPAVADLDGDGQPEVITQTRVLRGTDGATKFSYAASGRSNIIVSDVDGQPGIEIITYHGIIKSDGSKLCDFSGGILHQAAGRLRADDKAMIVVGRQGNSVVAFDGQTCAQVFTGSFPGGGGGPYNLADYDGDGELEMGSAGTANFATFDTAGALIWKQQTKDASSSQTGATTFDFNGDRKNEIVYNDEDFLRIYDGGTGKVLYQTANSSGTLFEYPIIADSDHDGHANIIVHANDCFSYTNQSKRGIRVFQAPANDWVGTRTVWNQHGYNPLLVQDDGDLTGIDPAKIHKPWLRSAHLTGFRNNIPMPSIKPECK